MQSVRWEDIPAERISDTVERRVLWGANGTSARLSLGKGAHVSKHSHPAEQFTAVLEGALRLDVASEQFTLRAGDMLVIPANAEHEAWALEDTVACDFFTEPRHDWKEGRSQYLAGK